MKTTEDLSLACGNTIVGREAFKAVVYLALETRIRLNSIAQKAVEDKSCDMAGLKKEEELVLGEFHSLRSEILKKISEAAVDVGNQVTLDKLCNSAA